MADQEQVELLLTDVEAWNQWRRKQLRGFELSYPDLISADLSGADLSGADLKNANLINANLRKADLMGANLSSANFRNANLSGANFRNANFREANLMGANLAVIQALRTDFSKAILTGACIEDWKINSATNLEGVICDYIYLKRNQQERRPSDPNKKFAPGEFTKLVEQSILTVDLVFKGGIDWRAFLSSFQELQFEVGEHNLSIQAIENKSDGAFVIRLNAPTVTDKEVVERQFWNKYQPLLEAKNREIKYLHQNNTRLLGIVETMAEKKTKKHIK